MSTGALKVEVGDYRPLGKGCLLGFFSIVIHPNKQKIVDCKYFAQGDKRWFNLPQKEIKKMDGSKSTYLPIVSYGDKDYENELREAVLTQLKLIEAKHPAPAQGEPPF